jgi:hypothetical protein
MAEDDEAYQDDTFHTRWLSIFVRSSLCGNQGERPLEIWVGLSWDALRAYCYRCFFDLARKKGE